MIVRRKKEKEVEEIPYLAREYRGARAWEMRDGDSEVGNVGGRGERRRIIGRPGERTRRRPARSVLLARSARQTCD